MRLAPGATQPGKGRLWDVWRSGHYAGRTRPRARITVQEVRLLHPSTGKGRWGNLHFNQTKAPVELPNLMDIDINPAVDADAATCTIRLANVQPRAFGGEMTYEDLDNVDLPGWYTFNRGDQGPYNRWKFARNQWHNVLVENRIIRTYQGYGADPLVAPHADANLMLTGTWMIDDVDIGSDRIITLTCRDAAKVLIEESAFPPVIPLKHYPISFEPRPAAKAKNPVARKERKVRLRPAASSNDRWTSGPVHGHTERHAFDGRGDTYWLSIGNSGPRVSHAFEYIEADAQKQDISDIEFTPWKGNYIVYVGVRVNGRWLGKEIVPYGGYAGASNGADEKYVLKTTCGTGEQELKLPQLYRNVERVRLTFHNLADSNLGPYEYRAGVREFRAFSRERKPPSAESASGTDAAEDMQGVIRYGDYTDIVKYLCAVGGAYCPPGATILFDPVVGPVPFSVPREPMVGSGGVWGSFEDTGTNGPNGTPISVFDKKPLMDGITHVREIVGFNFFMDEEGAPVWRSPNIWRLGNWLHEPGARSRTDYIPEIDERVQLKDLSVKLSDRNNRHRVVVATTDGRKGAVVPGREPNPMGLERISMFTDQHFETVAECRVMGELIAQRQLFSYRTDQVTIPGNPMLGVDDQVRIWERVTGEVYVHYIRGMSSRFDNTTGVWEMTLDTHWLGERPNKRWAVDMSKFSKETKKYLRAIGGDV